METMNITETTDVSKNMEQLKIKEEEYCHCGEKMNGFKCTKGHDKNLTTCNICEKYLEYSKCPDKHNVCSTCNHNIINTRCLCTHTC